jgi:hypothetical protein
MAVKWRFVFILLSFFIFTACDDNKSEKVDESIYTASEQVEYDGVTTYLDSYLYVNDMPLTSGNDFIAILKLYSIENSLPNDNISNVKLYILQENNILWQSKETNEITKNTTENYLEIIFRDGPSDDLRFKTVNIVLEFVFEGEKIQIMQKTLYIDSVI